MQDAKDYINNELAPIYRENPGESLDLGDFAYWAEQGSNLATSVIAFVALGKLAGAISPFARLSNATRGSKLAKLLKADIKANNFAAIANQVSMGKRGANVAGIGDAIFSSYLLTSAESVGSATDVYRSVKDRVFEEQLGKGLNPSEALKVAKREAINAGDFTMRFNTLNVLLNLTSVAPFLKYGKGAYRGPIAKRTLKRTGKRILQEKVLKNMLKNL